MKKSLIVVFSLSLILGCKEESTEKSMQLNYPETKKVDTIDTYFGTEIQDPYRWLEDDMSDETAKWVEEQNQVTFDFLNQIPFRNEINNRLTEFWNYEKISAPFIEGGITYFYKNDGLQDHYVVYRMMDEVEEVFLDPNTFSEDGTTSLDDLSFSKSGKLAAYSISEGGSDWRKVIVIDTETKEQVGDTLVDLKFTGIAWKGDEGFYYSTYEKPEGSQLSAMTNEHKLYFHKLNTNQKEDEVIFGGTENQKGRYIGGTISEDGRFLYISRSVSTSGNELYLMDLEKGDTKILPIIIGFENTTSVLDNKGSKLYIQTNLDAANQKIVTVDASNPLSENWEDLIPETEHVLSPSTGSGYIFARYMVDAVSKVKQFDFDGNLIREIELPGIGTAGGFGGKSEAENMYYSFSNYKTPSSIYSYDVETGTSEIYWQPEMDFDPDEYESNQVFYASKDGTKVPMIITHKKGLDLNGKNPTILYGYGGFNVSLPPGFSTISAVWLEMGGVYAVPNIRGGGEYGRAWHDAGIKLKKQNVFDDFIAAAEYLIDKRFTSSDYLAIRGASNGGLLVGAVVNQRPELFKVGIPQVGVMDMLRYHTFTAGAGWAYDYGTANDNEEMFQYLKSYSPLHNIQEGQNYPAIMVTTADHDDRVVPAHSFKYAAELQSKETGEAPKLIRIDVGAGHGAGMPVSKIVDLHTDIFGFILYNMGYDKLPE
ncbi:prolyl oligopeptidase family serine peptidase [Planktosalinus lacus]|uniref:prolyl oligopeptidase n=1 Tax=Planktosalinus lacus TaxID=1526573 RepID=A0A8J2Y802_9FLAO|nr:prolyl oligopeptidase family serine peptidase [Planktosalinus lacus]GGD80612.1 prolyl endopeptidase [Planktosalinus lacus]